MKKIIYAALFSLGFFASLNADAQTIVRSTLCGAGATWSNSTGALTSTFGQCPGCGTMQGNAGILTPGFQQPNNDTCSTSTFTFVETTDACGTTYNFTYTGNADVNLANLEWDFGPQGFPQTSTLANPQGVSFSSTGFKTVSLKVSLGSCARLSTADLDVPGVGFATNPVSTDVKCFGGSDGSIEITVNGGTPPFNYQWSTGELSASLADLPAGDYAYTVTDAAGCKSVNTATLSEAADSVSVEAITKAETCEGDNDGGIQVTVSGGTPPLNLIWDTGETTPTISNLKSGSHILSVTDGNGCETEVEVLVGQLCNPEIVDVLSPNGDGINDVWTIEGIESFPENEVLIYNRWGQVVWGVKGYANFWAGENGNGDPLPVGAYYYVVKLNNASNEVLSGSITIVR